MFDLVQEGWLRLSEIHTVTLDDVDMAHHTLQELRRARERMAKRSEAEYAARRRGDS